MTDLSPLAVTKHAPFLELALQQLNTELDKEGPTLQILEVGSGDGSFAALFVETVKSKKRQVSYTAVDPSPEETEKAKKYGTFKAVESGFLEFKEGKFDVILFTKSFHHIFPHEEAAKHAAELLAPKGILLLDEFSRETMDYATASWLWDTIEILKSAGVYVEKKSNHHHHGGHEHKHEHGTHSHSHSHSHDHKHEHKEGEHCHHKGEEGHKPKHEHKHEHKEGEHCHHKGEESHKHSHSHEHKHEHKEGEHCHHKGEEGHKKETEDALQRWRDIFDKHDPPLTEVRVLVEDLKKHFTDLTITSTPWLYLFIARGVEPSETGKNIVAKFLEQEKRKIQKKEIVSIGSFIVVKSK